MYGEEMWYVMLLLSLTMEAFLQSRPKKVHIKADLMIFREESSRQTVQEMIYLWKNKIACNKKSRGGRNS